MTDDDEPKLYRVDTVPPPAGESDAYNAPTKVGPMAASVVAEMMKAAEASPVEPKPASARPPLAVREDFAASRASDPRSEDSAAWADERGAVPRIVDVYEEAADEEGMAATLVSSLAKPPEVEPVLPPRPAIDEAPHGGTGGHAPAAQLAAPAERRWIDYVLILIIVAAAGGAIYLLNR